MTVVAIARHHGFGLFASAGHHPSLFAVAGVEWAIAESTFGDICQYEPLLDAMRAFKPELVLYLAARPLVRRSYRKPF